VGADERESLMNETINVVIVTYNNKVLLERCVRSVYGSLQKTGLNATVTVVDNNSTDGTRKLIREQFSSVHYIPNPENFGLSKALNIGIRSGLDSHYTMLLNDDVELFDDTVATLIGTLRSRPRSKVIPAALVHPDGTPQWMKLRIVGTQKDHGSNTRYTRFAGTTACLYYTAVFREVGGFDEFYFFYNEDLDFSLRMKRHGIRIVFNPKARAIHHQAKGRSKAEKIIRPYFYATDYYFYRKNYGPLFSIVYLMMAYFHILVWKRRFRRINDIEKLDMLEKGRNKLKDTIKNYRNLVQGANNVD
jgi:GT2 family glycosyltransferase